MKKTKKMKHKKSVIIATGGTGGHIFPAKAFAEFLIMKGYSVSIVADEKYLNYINGREKIEYKIVSTGKSLGKVGDVYKIIKGFFQALFFLKNKKPDIVVGFGGYASLPTLLVAKILRKQILLHEQNAYIGKINKFFLKDAQIIATSYREFYGIKYEYMNKIRFTGMPLRTMIKELAKKEYKIPNYSRGEKLNILIFGGSGGSKFFGEDLVNAIKSLNAKYMEQISIVQQCREEDVEKVRKIYNNLKIKNEIKTFFTDIDKKISSAHLVIARAGASSIAEFQIAGKPMILIPFPFATNNHQLKNAQSLVLKDAALVIEQNKFEEKEFLRILADFIQYPTKLEVLARKSKAQSILDADKKLLDIMENLINE